MVVIQTSKSWIYRLDKMAGPEYDRNDTRLTLIESKLRSYPDFPKKGILFYDLFSVLGDAEGLSATVSVIKVGSLVCYLRKYAFRLDFI